MNKEKEGKGLEGEGESGDLEHNTIVLDFACSGVFDDLDSTEQCMRFQHQPEENLSLSGQCFPSTQARTQSLGN